MQVSVGEDVEKWELSFLPGEHGKWSTYFGKQFCVISQKVKHSYHMIQQFHYYVPTFICLVNNSRSIHPKRVESVQTNS